MNNKHSEQSRTSSDNRSLDPTKHRRHLKEASQDSNQEKSEKSDNSGSGSHNKASDLFNFLEVGVFVRKKHLKTKSFGSAYSWKNSNSHKSNSILSTSKHSDEGSDKQDLRSHSKQDSGDTSNKAGNDDNNSQNLSYQNLSIDIKPRHLQKKSCDTTVSRSSYENVASRFSVIPKNVFSHQLNPKQENTNDSGETKSKSDSNDSTEKTTPPVEPYKERMIPVPVASKMIKEDVMQRIKNKIISTSNTNNPNQSFSFLSDLKSATRKDRRSEVPARFQEERKNQERSQPRIVAQNPIILSVNNQEVYADGTELDLSPHITTPFKNQLPFKTSPMQNKQIPLSVEESLISTKNQPRDLSDERQNDVLKSLYRQTRTPCTTPRWEQTPMERRSQIYGSNYTAQGGLQEIPEVTPQINIATSDIQSPHMQAQSYSHNIASGETSQRSQTSSLSQKFATPQHKNTVAKKNLSALSTEATFDGDFLANHENLNNSFTTVATHFSGNKNSDRTEFQTPPRTESDVRLYDDYEYQTRTHSNQKYQKNDSRYSFGATDSKTYLRSKPTPGLNQSAIILGGESSDRSSSINDEYTVHSNYSTPQSQSQPLNFFPQNKNLMDNSVSTPPGYRMAQPFLNPSNQQSPSLNIMNVFQGLGIQSTGSLNYPTDVTGGNQHLKPPGKNSKKIPEDEQNSEAYEIDIYKVDNNPKTTIMIKNIPNKYNRNLMMQDLNKNHEGTYDFFYLPIDFKNKCNVGYAFINFIDNRFIKQFFIDFNNKKWERFKSEKICKIKYARLQGLQSLKQHFKASIVMNQQDENLRPWILEDELLRIQQQNQQQQPEEINQTQNSFIERPFLEGIVKQQKAMAQQKQ